MDENQSLSQSKWDGKYHVVFDPRCRRKALLAGLRAHLEPVFHALDFQKLSRIEEGRFMLDHVHMLMSIPPKYAVSQVIGFIKGTGPIHVATGGRDEAVIRNCIRSQEAEDTRLDQLKLYH